MNKEFTAVGKRITQKDVVLKATGEAIFVPDVKLQGQLWGKILHSKYAHAKFTIDKTRALALPGVVCVITYEDTPKIPYCRSFRDMPMTASGQLQHSDEFILADKARFVGDPIAAVAAVDEKTAEAAIELLEADVKYEVLPFVIDPRDALKPGAPVIHDYSPNNNPVNSTPPPWLAIGDLEKGFAESDLVVEDNFYCSRQIQSHLETQSCCATVDSNNKITVYSPNQLAHPFRRELGKMFN
ncbi:MAG: molybdopterin cofactor-binding domain-containing protein, partial [Syntrophaceae bacterium]